MKLQLKSAILLSGLLLIPVLGQSQQDEGSKVRKRSLTVTLGPAFFATSDAKLNPETFWPASLYVTKNYMLNKRWTFSAGGHFLYKKLIMEGFAYTIIEGSGGSIKTTTRMVFIDMPVSINFHVIRLNDKFNFYLKSELKNSIAAVHVKEGGESHTNSEVGYNMFLGFGAGTDFKIANRFSIVLEPGINYSVIGILPQVLLADCQIGVKYCLIKNN
jgi:hypothetical protein